MHLSGRCSGRAEVAEDFEFVGNAVKDWVAEELGSKEHKPPPHSGKGFGAVALAIASRDGLGDRLEGV